MRQLLLMVTCLWSVCMHAQLRLGLQGGYNRVKWAASDAVPTSTDENYATSGLSGFQSGVVAEIRILNSLSLRSGVFISGKGTTLKHQSQSWNDTSSRSIWIRYLEAPVTLIYYYNLYKQVRAFTGGGFYAAQAFRGVEKGEGHDATGPYTMYNEVEFSNQNENQIYPTIMKPFDYGYTFLTGIERNRVQLLLTYSRGIKNLLPNSFNGNYRNSTLSLSLAYLLSTKKHKQDFL